MVVSSTPVGLLLVLAVAAVLLLPAPAAAASAQLAVDGSGDLSVSLTGEISNGSALRSAMDGEFGPLLSLLVTNASQRASLLAQINASESSPLLGLLFGNRDGTVSGTEVTTFESLLEQESQLLPSGTLTGSSTFGLELDGQGPTTARLTTISFLGATGPDTSSAPINVTTSLAYRFPYAGTSHTLAFQINLTSASLPLGVLTGPLNLSVSLPAGTSVRSTSGFASETTSNDPLGWGPASVVGTFLPSSQSTLTVSYGPAFPTGDVLVVAPVVVAAGLAAFLLLRRRRRRRAVPP